LPDRKFKVVAYKCKSCHKFHVGRNGNTISDKEKEKWKPKGFTIIGKINL
jgi:transposase-like protein